MWKKGTSPLFPAFFSPRDMVGKGERFPHQRGIGMFYTRFQGGIHRKMWKGEGFRPLGDEVLLPMAAKVPKNAI